MSSGILGRTEMTTKVVDAIRRGISALLSEHPGEKLIGYALLTDDNLRTVGHAACTEEWLETSPEANARFEPVEWAYCEGTEVFDEVRSALWASADAASRMNNIQSHAEEGFDVLVAALEALRKEGLFEIGVFLTVISTDPNALMLRLEEDAVNRLNSVDMTTKWKAETGR